MLSGGAHLEIGPQLEVRVVAVLGGGLGVLVHLVEDELARVLLVLQHIEAEAARLSARTLGVLSHDVEELVEPLRLHLDVHQDGNHLRDVQARRRSTTATAATFHLSAGCG